MKPRSRTEGDKRRRNDRDEGDMPPLLKKGAKYLEGVSPKLGLETLSRFRDSLNWRVTEFLIPFVPVPILPEAHLLALDLFTINMRGV